MKNKKVMLSFFLAIISASIMTSSCRKESMENREADAAFTESEFASNDADNLADAAGRDQSGYRISAGQQQDTYMSMSACATVTKDSTGGIFTRTIDFGTSNCLCHDNRYRRGKVIITHTGGYFTVGSVKTITFVDYYVNDNHLEGTRKITNVGDYVWTIEATNMKLTKTDGSYISWNSSRTRTMTAGSTTPLVLSDDVYKIEGSWNGTRLDGKTMTANITTPLIRELSCKWIGSGVIEITTSGDSHSRTIDYGNGNCDDQATVSYRHRTKNITLK
jgi:hypothetical protein